MTNKKTTSEGEIRLLPPRQAPLSAQQQEEAVALLTELLTDAAAKRRGVRSAGAFGSASGGVSGGVIPFPEKRREGREVA